MHGKRIKTRCNCVIGGSKVGQNPTIKPGFICFNFWIHWFSFFAHALKCQPSPYEALATAVQCSSLRCGCLSSAPRQGCLRSVGFHVALSVLAFLDGKTKDKELAVSSEETGQAEPQNPCAWQTRKPLKWAELFFEAWTSSAIPSAIGELRRRWDENEKRAHRKEKRRGPRPHIREAAMLPRNATLQKLDLGLGAQVEHWSFHRAGAERRAKAGTPLATAVQPASLQRAGSRRRTIRSRGCLGCCDEAEHGSHGPGRAACNRGVNLQSWARPCGDRAGAERHHGCDGSRGGPSLTRAARSRHSALARSWSEALVSKKSCIRLAGNPLEEAIGRLSLLQER